MVVNGLCRSAEQIHCISCCNGFKYVSQVYAHILHVIGNMGR